MFQRKNRAQTENSILKSVGGLQNYGNDEKPLCYDCSQVRTSALERFSKVSDADLQKILAKNDPIIKDLVTIELERRKTVSQISDPVTHAGSSSGEGVEPVSCSSNKFKVRASTGNERVPLYNDPALKQYSGVDLGYVRQSNFFQLQL